MKLNTAYKFRIYPNAAQEELFAKTFGCVRFIYNQMLYDKINHYKETGQSLNVTPAQYKEDYEWLREVDSLALANAQLNLDGAYRKFFKIEEPKYSKKTIEKFERLGKPLTFYHLETCLPAGRNTLSSRKRRTAARAIRPTTKRGVSDSRKVA
jgi:putative transposase